MKNLVIAIFIRSLLFIVLTLLTMVGGFSYLLGLLLRKFFRIKQWPTYILLQLSLYITLTWTIVPNVAPMFGREPVTNTAVIKPTNYWLTVGLNRNYVVSELNAVLANAAQNLQNEHPGLEIRYLDANFPFIDRFPLLPHLSHNDGRKIDLSFVYKNQSGNLTNSKPALSGYGVFAEPLQDEKNTAQFCKEQGYFQYDYTKYLTFGRFNSDLIFAEQATKKLLESTLQDRRISKVFIEPHLKQRLHLTDPRIRFHGCRAVRHDDHIHLQI